MLIYIFKLPYDDKIYTLTDMRVHFLSALLTIWFIIIFHFYNMIKAEVESHYFN